MKPFDFQLPTIIKIRNGLFKDTASYIKKHIQGRRVLIVTDPGIEQLGYPSELSNQLNSLGYVCTVYTNVKPNPRDVDCINGGERAREFQADLIVAIGGGSVIDSAKAIAILSVFGGSTQDYSGKDLVPGPVLPLVVIPTTAGTGAEVTRSSVITDSEKKRKFTIKDVHIAPKLALVDPELTYKLPALLTASTGMDALVHAIEAYTCKLSNPIAEGLAIEAMTHIYPYLKRAVLNGEDYEAREHLMIGSTIAGMAFSHADVASVHCMAEAIGGLYDTPHGIANSMFLPYVLAFNAETEPVKHGVIARTLGLADPAIGDEEATQRLVEAMKQLAREIRIPTFASLPSVRPEDFSALSEAAFQNGSTPSNARTITKEDYLNLFKKAYHQPIE
ncbi:iron-containing alcohol dehydrogenase [Pullulanibacillus sp. KACC 23026]|uniref:iron-containing alcohol dehydrogenase n=1 Tax=Pullulanibacillus sp. KACC 23026 TaxID=3028315 RepID=UPI0023AF607A|nr:iron-containing alcohol dehydrogenase [Pullulanibacillus sp. KACC 23026]WEG12389.1 iron-containing alcohol dehydrogenase [Pullulanibacillus sp. KACC 23026]